MERRLCCAQLAWMFVCLYGLPEIIPRYYIGERYKPKYYGEQCLERTGDARICNWADLQRGLNDDWYRQRHTSLSVLFNAFICMQVANEVASRRIYDEYDFLSGLLTNPVFMAVIVITMGLQAIIINFLGTFFKTVPLDWKEWLACIAIGLSSWPVSWATRWVSRTFNVHRASDARTGVALMNADVIPLTKPVKETV
ncbi:calcium-transporting ATPase [Haematococcus lacustris]|uniref:Calcium-transporting ATPase n=1 Tax=Haematococcus lacustris TaxID=44745 RepID=A0A699ZLY9_HAELA|nr:calcium-transporting ATPase [Haematococcus lacustris]